ncbi:hypothetical protein PAMP_010063 [Pampus punctatissimus]
MPRCGARRQSGKHRLNLGSTALRAFVIWRHSSRQVAAVVDCSLCTLTRQAVRSLYAEVERPPARMKNHCPSLASRA